MAIIENAKAKAKEIGSIIKEKAMETKEKASEFVEKHEGVAIAVLSVIGAVMPTAISIAAANNEEKQKHYQVKDDRTGEKLNVKHPLTNDEILDMGDRMEANDLSKGEALRDMGLLKKERSRK